jgi:hypothetical protein
MTRDRLRAARLRRSDPLLKKVAPRPERIVVALTTVPERVGVIQPTLRSLLDQSCVADRVLLAWPSRSWRSGELYPAPPAVPPGIDIVPCEDEGPATKLLAALPHERACAIVVVDDDVIYPYNFLETLLDAHRADPGAALGFRGWKLKSGMDPRNLPHVFGTGVSRPTDVDVLFGTWGYLLPPSALDQSVHEFGGWPPEVRWSDDIWISGHLARRNVPRRVVPIRGYPIETPASRVASLCSGPNHSGHNDRVAIAAFARWW